MHLVKKLHLLALLAGISVFTVGTLMAMTFITFLDTQTTIEDRFVPEYNQMLSELLDDITEDCKAVAMMDDTFVLQVFKVCMKQSVIGIKNEGIIAPQEKNELFAIINYLPEDYCQCDLTPLVLPRFLSALMGSVVQGSDYYILDIQNTGDQAENWEVSFVTHPFGWNPPSPIDKLPAGFAIEFNSPIAPNQFILTLNENDPDYWTFPDNPPAFYIDFIVRNCAGEATTQLCINCIE